MTFDRFTALIDENFGGADIDKINEDDVMLMIHSQVFGFDKSMVININY